MDRIAFVLMILFVTASIVTGAKYDAYCKGSSLICETRFEGYDDHTHKMQELYEQNKQFINIATANTSTFKQQDRVVSDEENCESVTTWETPYAIKSRPSLTSDLVVQLPNFKQQIRYTTCLDKDEPCFENIFFSNSSARCKEKMTGVSLYIFDPDQGKMVYKMFEIPVACACKFPK